MLVTSGEELGEDRETRIGVAPDLVVTRTPTDSKAKTCPRLSALGHEMFTSMALTAGLSRRIRPVGRTPPPSRRRWRRRQPRCVREPGQVVGQERLNARALQTDRVEHSRRGLDHARVGRPDRARIMMLLVTTPPISVKSKNVASSLPAAAQPDAVERRSCELHACEVDAGDLIIAGLRCTQGSGGHVPTSDHRTRSPKNTGPSVHERTMRVTPSSPMTGSTHVMHTPTPQAIDSSTAHWATAP